MKLKFLLVSLLLSLGCGKPQDGRDGISGPQGPQGEDGKDGEDGKTPQPIPGPAGPAGPQGPSGAVVVATTSCALTAQMDPANPFPKYELAYEVVTLGDQTALVSLKEKHYFRASVEPAISSNSMIYAKSSPGYNAAMVESTLWTAKLKTAKTAEFVYKPDIANPKQVSCQ